MTQTLASLHRAVSALGPTYPILWDLRGRYLFLQVSTSLNLLLAVKAGSPDNLAVANEPTPRASTNSSAASSSDSSPSLPPRGQGGASEDWNQSLFPLTLSFDAVAGKPPSFNGCGSATTSTDEGDHDEEDVIASLFWRRGNRLFPIPKPAKPLRHAHLKPFSLDVREDKYEKEGDKDEGDEDKRGAVIMDSVLPNLPMQHIPMHPLAKGHASSASLPELPSPQPSPTSNWTSSPIASSPVPLAAYAHGIFQATNERRARDLPQPRPLSRQLSKLCNLSFELSHIPFQQN